MSSSSDFFTNSIGSISNGSRNGLYSFHHLKEKN
jgi:hypothetical protein